MSTTGTNLINQINTYVRNYAVTAFHDMKLNAILLQLVAWIDSGGTTGPIITANVYPVTVANFTNATDCPIVSLNGLNIQVFYNAAGRFLSKTAGEWTDLAGGGFKVLLAGYDSSVNDANFYIYVSA